MRFKRILLSPIDIFIFDLFDQLTLFFFQLTWNPLWGFGLKYIFRKELYTHSDICGGLWAIDAFLSDANTVVLSAASDGSVRGGFVSAMTTSKARTTSALHVCQIRAVTQNAAGLWEVHVDSSVRMLASALGSETFPQSSTMAVHCLHSVQLGPAITTAPALVKASRTSQSEATTPVAAAPTPSISSFFSPQKKATPVAAKKVEVVDLDEEDEDLVDTSSDSGSGSEAAPSSTRKPSAKSKKTPASAKATTTTPKKVSASATPGASAAEPVQPAELRLVAYGGQVGLLRIHSFDPRRVLVAPTKLSANK